MHLSKINIETPLTLGQILGLLIITLVGKTKTSRLKRVNKKNPKDLRNFIKKVLFNTIKSSY